MFVKKVLCSRCQGEFYAVTVKGNSTTCPFCGYTFEIPEKERRRDERYAIQKDCSILKEGNIILARTFNISKRGLGLKVTGPMSFDVARHDLVHIIINDLEIDSDAMVVWVKRFNGLIHKMGLRF